MELEMEKDLQKDLQRIDIAFENLSYIVPVPKQKEKKQVLKGVSGRFKSGELTAIMGPSGAGKSSLLQVLTGFTTKGVSGSLDMNNENQSDLSNKKCRKLCSYILQDDNLFPWFTVLESMNIAANLKISRESMTMDEKQSLIDHILDTLHLSYSKNTRCSNLSGGQKKRLSIALELLDNPPILFLDEPTTGLDSSSSNHTIRLLHTLSREGRTIVCTIHQPSATIFELFDHVYVLAEGHCVYQGSSHNTIPFLGSLGLNCPQYHNAADYMLEVANGEYGNFVYQLAKAAINERWRNSSSTVYIQDNLEHGSSIDRIDDGMDCRNELLASGSDVDEKRISVYTKTSDESSSKSIKSGFFSTPSELTQLWVLIGRCNVQLYRDWTVTHLKLLLHILCAIVIGLYFGDSGINASKSISNIGFLLVNIVYIWYTTMMPGVLRFPAEISILKKETFNNWYKLRTYYLANLITSTPVHMLFASVYASIAYFITEQPPEPERFLKFVLIFVLLACVADGFGTFLGTIVNPINGTFLGAICSCFMIVFSGFLVLFNHMPNYMYYVSNLSFHRYCLEALVITLYQGGRPDIHCPKNVMYCHYNKSKTILNELGVYEDRFAWNMYLILGQLFLFKILGYFSLRRRLSSG